MLTKALLLSTLTIVNPSAPPTLSQTSDVLSDSDMCQSAMRQTVEHNNLENHIYSTKRGELKARKGNVTLTVTCEPLKEK